MLQLYPSKVVEQEVNTKIKDNDLVLFDLGCCTDYYISDISRTYPASGKFTERQKQIYNIVLNCNKKCIEFLKPGVTWDEFNKYANSLLIEGLKEIGLIKEDKELINYYFHGVSHHLGLDTHDACLRNKPLKEGFQHALGHGFKDGLVIRGNEIDKDTILEGNMVFTVEPGLYIEEEKIGIRIENDVLVTKDGYIDLASDIIKTVEDIENFMKK